MSPTVGFHAISRTPLTAGLTAIYTLALAAKCHASLLTCVLEAFMLTLSKVMRDWLKIALKLAKICGERHPMPCHNLNHLQ